MAAVLALLLFLPVPLLQGLGHTGTCTQNDTDPFLTGAFLSLPFVAGSFGLAWRSARCTRAGTGKGRLALIGLSSLALAVLAAALNAVRTALHGGRRRG